MIRRAKAFSAFGMIVVVMVLALTAAIVSPRFSQAGIDEARMDELCNSLQLLRAQIELYKVQHRDQPPMLTTEGTVAFDPNLEQMIYCTDVDGHVKTEKPKTKSDDTYAFGPYLKEVPTNPFNASRMLVRIGSCDDVPAAGGAGWAYVPKTGEIYANDNAPHAGL